MKVKKYLALVAIAALVSAMFLTACSSSEFATVSDENGKSMIITATNAGTDSSSISGSLIVGDNDEIIIESSLEEGSIQLDFLSGEDFDDMEDVPSGEVDSLLEAVVGPGETQTCEISSGEYMVKVSVLEKATGSVNVTIKEKEGNGWSDAESTDDAADKAGLDMFMVDPEGLSLGDVTNAEYHYKEGCAQAYYGVAAVDLYVNKGLHSVYNGDVSEDTTKYAHEWTQNIKGLEVTCYGNRDGEATKTIWSLEDYDYAILAYGAGGDTDFGLSADDVSSLINSIQ